MSTRVTARKAGRSASRAILVERCNEEFRDDAEARVVAVLGELEDSLQLWCIPKRALSSLLRAPFFQAENRARLSALVPAASRGSR